MAARPSTDVFRPCLPFDPFAGVEPSPWKPSIGPHADPPSAVLVLGDPEPADLHPILFSQSLANSLVVLVTHAPPEIPGTPIPAVRILRLAASLVQDAGALRLVGLFERADRVVRRFRVNRAQGSRKLVQLTENSTTGEFDVEEAYSAAEPPSPSRMRLDVIPRYPSPAPSASSSLSSSTSSVRSSFSTTSSISRRRRARVPSSQPPPNRAFDAIINFLPCSLPDKFLLKHAILLSTLSASFVAAPPAPLLAPSEASANSRHRSSDVHTPEKKSRRFSALLRRSPATNHSAPDIHDTKGKSRSHMYLTPSSRRPHLVHVLPEHVYHLGARGSSKKPPQQKAKPKPKLVQSIEQFLLAFGYPLQSMSLLPSSASNSSPGSKRISMTSTMSSSFLSASASFNAGSGTDGTGEKPIPFLLPAGVLGSAPTGGRLSIGEILLMGGFDGSGSGIGVGEGMVEMGIEEGRVWIGSPDDVVWDDDLESLSTSPTRTPSTLSSPLLQDSTHSHLHAPSPTHPRARPTRSSSLPTPSPYESTLLPSSSLAAINPPPSAQLAPSKPGSPFPVTAPSPLSPPVPTHIPNGKLTKPNLLSKTNYKRSSTSSSLSPSETVAPKELNHTQLPTPPESASSLEDGGNDDDDDDRTTNETTGSLPSVAASMTDHRHPSSPYQQGKPHYVKAASTLGHGRGPGGTGVHKGIGGGGGMGLKGFMARFGFGFGSGVGMGKWRVLKVGERN